MAPRIITPVTPTVTGTTTSTTTTSPTAPSNTVTVSNAQDLTAALKSAHAGETILLAPGTYSGLDIKNQSFSSAVTIASANAAAPAVLTAFNIANSSGFNFNNLEFSTSGANTPFAFRFTDSSNIQISNSSVHGSLDNNPQNDVSGIYLSGASNVSITNTQFQQLDRGIVNQNSSNIAISGNSFHDIESDGIDASGTSHIVISGNSFTNFYPTAADHPDAIQFFTAGTTASASAITISNNVVTRGNGGAVQGIFLSDQVNLPFQGVTISGNIVAGGMGNGIAVIGANNVTIANNVVTDYSGQDSFIRVQSAGNVVMSNNSSMAFVMIGNTGPVTQSADVITQAITPNGQTTLASLLVSASPLGASAISHTSTLTAALLQMTR